MSDHTSAAAPLPGYARGVGLTALGGFLLTFDALLLRLIHVDQWSLVFARGIVMFLSGLVAWLTLRGRIESAKSFFNGGAGLFVAFLYGASSICFVRALGLTKVADVLFLAATSPLFAALLSLIVLKERIHRVTWAAMLASLMGILLVVGDGLGGGNWRGNVLALASAATLGGAFVVARRSGRGMFMAPAVGGLVSTLVAAPFVQTIAFPASQWGFIELEGGILVPLALGLIAIGPKYLPAPQVGLFMLLQTVIGPLWVWLFLGEACSARSVVGGAIIVGTLALNSAYFIWKGRQAERATIDASSGANPQSMRDS